MSEPLLVRGPPVGDPLWIIVSEQSTHFGWSLTGGSIIVERIVVKYFVFLVYFMFTLDVSLLPRQFCYGQFVDQG